MKIATVGKGGSGKTTIAGLLARIFAAENHNVLAIDGDPNPNLALTLGMTREAADTIVYIPSTVMRINGSKDGIPILEPTLPRDEIMRQFAHKAAENVDLIVMGKPAHGSAGTGCMCASHRAVRGLIAELTDFGEHTITDMEAGLEHLKRGTARHVDLMLVVAEPYYRSLEAALRTFELAVELGIPYVQIVANKARSIEEQAAIEAFCRQHGMPIIGSVPHDEAFARAEMQAKSPYDFAPQSPGVRAVHEIADRIAALETPPPREGAGEGAAASARS